MTPPAPLGARPNPPRPAIAAWPRRTLVLLGTTMIVFNLGAWLWALIAFRDYPLLLGTALLAYSLGLRHAVDADHIAAIDNVTRSLMQQGQRPVTVGFLFSLGRSTVVVLASTAIAAAARALQRQFDGFHAIGGIDKLQPKGPIWDWLGALVVNLGNLGYGIVAIFVTGWLLSAAIYRWRRYDELEPLTSPRTFR